MNTYRAIVRQTVVTDTLVEVDAADMRNAAQKFDAFAADGHHRAVRIIRPLDQDPDPRTDREVIEIKERR